MAIRFVLVRQTARLLYFTVVRFFGGRSFTFLAAGTWFGVLSCADCSDAIYKLALNHDSTYQEVLLCKGSKTPVVQTGRWRVGGPHIYPPEKIHFGKTLASNVEFMVFRRDTLLAGTTIIDGLYEQWRIDRRCYLTRCVENVQEWGQQQRYNGGINFVAGGNKPWEWGLSIDSRNVISFKALTTKEYRSAEPVTLQNKDTVRYEVQTETGPLLVEILNKSFRDSISGDHKPYTVYVTASGERFSGGGIYLNKGALNNIWLLQQFSGRDVNAADWYWVPTLNFLPEIGNIKGYAGCSSISGSIQETEDKVSFGDIYSTKKSACSDQSLEQEFLEAISGKTFHFKLDSNRLLLLDGNKEVMVFSSF